MLLRDRLEDLVQKRALAVHELEELGRIDETLRHALPHVKGATVLRKEQLLRTVTPAEQAWWWRPANAPSWTVFSAVMLGLTATLAADFAKTTLADNPDAWGIVAVIAQSGLTLAAGATFTRTGTEWLRAIGRRIGVGEVGSRTRALVSTVLALLVFLSWQFLPSLLAWSYNAKALAECPSNSQCDQAPSSIRLFQRAASLKGDNRATSTVRFNLGRVYELVHDYDKAVDQYRLAVELDPNSPSALNNWAWLLLVQDKSPNMALSLLQEAARLGDKRRPANGPYLPRISIHKNLALAYLRAGLYDLAEDEAQTSIKLVSELKTDDQAASHCVLASVLSRLQRDAEAKLEAQRCVSLARVESTAGFASNASKPDEISLGFAKQLMSGEKKGAQP